MIVRTVLAVVLAAALVGASLPAIDDARRDHADAAVRDDIDRFERAANGLLATDDPVDVQRGARRVVTLRLPARSWRDVGVEAVAFESAEDGRGARVTWRLRGGLRHVRRLPGVPLRTAGESPLVAEAAGRNRLILSLDGSPGEPVVTVRRFINQEGTTPSHATVASDD